MEVQTPKTTRRSSRIRVEINVSVTSLDRMRPFSESCTVLVASAQGCGIRSPRPLQLETPIMLNGLPGGGSVTARVANCIPLGTGGDFLIGASLYTHGNVWGIANPPEDWAVAPANSPAAEVAKQPPSTPQLTVNKKSWPYNMFESGADSHSGSK